MSVYIENEANLEFDFGGSERIIENAVGAVMHKKNIPDYFDVNVLITTEDGIREINHRYRGIASVTDVLSFPYFDFKKEEEFAEGIDGSGEVILGDIVLCAKKIISQAKEYAHSQKRELAFLTVHSMLHLLGYDHENEDDAGVMESQQKEIMEMLGIYD